MVKLIFSLISFFVYLLKAFCNLSARLIYFHYREKISSFVDSFLEKQYFLRISFDARTNIDRDILGHFFGDLEAPVFDLHVCLIVNKSMIQLIFCAQCTKVIHL